MNISLLIERLKSLGGPDRLTDEVLALYCGWRRTKDEQTESNFVWLSPDGDAGSNPPHYTRDLTAAYDFAQQIVPNNVGACTWLPGSGSAAIEGLPNVDAPSAPLALCIVALMAKQHGKTF